ncbi:excalibur calcium-binding domain-containing protein [Mycobacterium sp. 236(2023)]|nr:excalibur calcium-binding domain-containing protein [Mycobacterium sp. 236(2023)]MDG4663704.1 excalibur calcium-binding domain-containing protein [Mycobacterium sp. 236(2023)]
MLSRVRPTRRGDPNWLIAIFCSPICQTVPGKASKLVILVQDGLLSATVGGPHTILGGIALILRALILGSAVGAIALGGAVTAIAQPGSTPFENCTAARKAGYGDIPSSSPYYGTHLDSDSDGIGCER